MGGFPPRRLGLLQVGLVTMAGALFAACSKPSEGPAPGRPGKPNVLIITLDTTRADHLGCYGYLRDVSPNIDRFAKTGTVFTSAIGQAAVTPVAHASIFTGLNPYSHGLRVLHGLDENRLSESRVTLAEVLKKEGYQTAAFVSAFPVTQRFGLHQGFDIFDADFMAAADESVVSADGIVNADRVQQRADATTDRGLAWLADAGQPFFLWLHFFDPHDPRLQPPEAVLRRHGIRPWSEQGLRPFLKELYDVEIEYMDQHIGRVLDELQRRGELDEMITVVVADHGEGLGDHDWWTHGILYQEQVRLPLIIRAPGKPAGRRVDYLVRSIDIMPTVLDLVGPDLAHVPPMEGSSLAPLLDGDPPDPRYVAYCDSVNMLVYRFATGINDEKSDMLFAVFDGRWKYIHHLKLPEQSELYDLSCDPGEKENLRTTFPDDAARLRADLMRRRFLPSGRLGRQSMSLEDLERLRSLGYVR
ncbi:MAG: sulfatase [Planctomycetota bacterium]